MTQSEDDNLRIGQLALLAGVGVETIRFYERKGLLRPPPRGAGGFRRYPPAALERIIFIRRAKDLGFSLREIEGLLSIRDADHATCGDIRQKAEATMVSIDARIHALQKMRGSLAALLHQCEGAAPVRRCPIVLALTFG